ncbi:porin [Flavobacterium faecale]|uniref:porin n=1 Tax=Flavobacterium faecale TaxID=1355330 RepID=UPI003AAEDBEC
MKKIIFSLVMLLFMAITAQSQSVTETPKTSAVSSKKWFETISLRGYMQVRYNKLLETNSDLGCEQCDKSWGGNNSFFVRRGRLVFSGNVHDRVYIYIQPDFASSASTTSNNFLQIRDAYADISLDAKKEFRFRIGQSKVPYGFENMQSSQNRLTLDRNDALNSAVANERDLGVMFYWAPKEKRELFSNLIRDGLKGSGDYGVVGLGIYNGQTANRVEANNNQHIVGRVSYPFEFKNGQVLEAGIQGYTGKYVVQSISTSKNVIVKPNGEYLDQRAAASFVLYPKPFGLQAEYNIGTGPEYNPANNTIEQKKLHGGYMQAFYNIKVDQQVVLPFVKYQMYRGGKKHELDARSYSVNDLEIGLEWQPFKNLEIVADYTISSRRYEDAVKPINVQQGNLLRLQLQINF